MIWHRAVSVPRVVEVEETSSGTTGANFISWGCICRDTPPLLATCHEAQKVVLKAYNNGESNKGKEGVMCRAQPIWCRYDWDILHLKNMNFSDKEKNHMRAGFLGSGGWPELEMTRTAGYSTGEGCRMGSFFGEVKALALNRELYLST